MRIFYKYTAAGNDFILFEDFEKNFPKESISLLCHRQWGIGADGLILIGPSFMADFEMLYFNADGSKPSMCGNGLRCAAHFLRQKGWSQSFIQIQVGKNVFPAKWEGEKIFTLFETPQILHWGLELDRFQVFVVDSGVPHAVIFCNETVDIPEEGLQISQNFLFGSEGVNVNFVKLVEKNRFVSRTYERGVGETLACGTGAIAVAFVANRLGLCSEDVEILTRSEKILEVHLDKRIALSGPVQQVFKGEVAL